MSNIDNIIMTVLNNYAWSCAREYNLPQGENEIIFCDYESKSNDKVGKVLNIHLNGLYSGKMYLCIYVFYSKNDTSKITVKADVREFSRVMSSKPNFPFKMHKYLKEGTVTTATLKTNDLRALYSGVLLSKISEVAKSSYQKLFNRK